MILTPIYEAEFLGFSYGFRPGRGQHDALDALAYGIKGRNVRWILDADILGRINDHKINRLDELLPWNWKPLADATENQMAA